jgi:hypothetical protein
MRRSFAVIGLVLLAGLTVFLPLVRAQDGFTAQEVQDPTQVSTSSAQVDPQEELTQLTQKYYSEVEEYRDIERKYLIARETYYKNNTLAAQEEAIRLAQELIKARADVLSTYFTYLQRNLENTLGIELDDKVVMANRLESIRADLEESKKDAGRIKNRTQVDQTFADMNLKQKELTANAYETLALIKIGQIQNAIDQATITREMVSSWIKEADITEASALKKTRGLEEVDRLIQSSKNNLTEVTTRWRARMTTNQYSEGSYQAFQEDSEYSYLQLRQAHSFLDETVRTP